MYLSSFLLGHIGRFDWASLSVSRGGLPVGRSMQSGGRSVFSGPYRVWSIMCSPWRLPLPPPPSRFVRHIYDAARSSVRKYARERIRHGVCRYSEQFRSWAGHTHWQSHRRKVERGILDQVVQYTHFLLHSPCPPPPLFFLSFSVRHSQRSSLIMIG